MKPTIEQIDAAISAADEYVAQGLFDEKTETVLFALRFTKKMMARPSGKMLEAVITNSEIGEYVASNWSAATSCFDEFSCVMVNQAIKEVEDEN